MKDSSSRLYEAISRIGYRTVTDFLRNHKPQSSMIELGKELGIIPMSIRVSLLKEDVSVNEAFRLSFVRSYNGIFPDGWSEDTMSRILLAGALGGTFPVDDDELDVFLGALKKINPVGWKPASADDPLLLQLTKGKFERAVFEGPGIEPDP